jgi:hypothetical protein
MFLHLIATVWPLRFDGLFNLANSSSLLQLPIKCYSKLLQSNHYDIPMLCIIVMQSVFVPSDGFTMYLTDFVLLLMFTCQGISTRGNNCFLKFFFCLMSNFSSTSCQPCLRLLSTVPADLPYPCSRLGGSNPYNGAPFELLYTLQFKWRLQETNRCGGAAVSPLPSVYVCGSVF